MKAKQYVLTRQNMLTFLGKLGQRQDEAVTVHIPAGTRPDDVDRILSGTIDSSVIPEQTLTAIHRSATGTVVFWGKEAKYIVSPPFYLRGQHSTNGYDTEALQAMLDSDPLIAFILVRLGSYAVGLWKGDVKITSKVGTGLVHGRHRQGGSSEGRFARHREKQIETFLNRVSARIRTYLSPHYKDIDYMVYGGARTTILALEKQCRELHQFDDRTLPPLLEIPDPRYYVLEQAVIQAWLSRVTELVE